MKKTLEKIRTQLRIQIDSSDNQAKIISLVLAITLWGYIFNLKTGELTFRVSLESRNVPRGMMVLDMKPESVLVKIEGKKELMKNLSSRNLRAVVDLSREKEPGEKFIPVIVEQKGIPEGINVIAGKNKARVILDEFSKKTVRIVPRTTGTSPKGSFIGKIDVEPDTVTISGPKSEIKGIDFIFTSQVNITGINKKIEQQVGLDTEKLKSVTLNVAQVKVSVSVINYGDLLSMPIPLEIAGARDGFSYTLVNPTVKVYYKYSGTREISARDFRGVVNVSTVAVKKLKPQKDGTYNVQEVKLSVDTRGKIDGLEIVSFTPGQTEIKIEKK
jgi:YbbR domain-containing protein